MRSLGRTYLVEVPDIKEQYIEDSGILLPAENKNNLVHYRGVVVGIGLGFKEDFEVKVGDVVIFNWKEKQGKVKVIFNQKLYYILEESLVLAVEEEE